MSKNHPHFNASSTTLAKKKRNNFLYPMIAQTNSHDRHSILYSCLEFRLAWVDAWCVNAFLIFPSKLAKGNSVSTLSCKWCQLAKPTAPKHEPSILEQNSVSWRSKPWNHIWRRKNKQSFPHTWIVFLWLCDFPFCQRHLRLVPNNNTFVMNRKRTSVLTQP